MLETEAEEGKVYGLLDVGCRFGIGQLLSFIRKVERSLHFRVRKASLFGPLGRSKKGSLLSFTAACSVEMISCILMV